MQTPEGKPIALFSELLDALLWRRPISADYYGDFVRIVSGQLAAGDNSFIA